MPRTTTARYRSHVPKTLRERVEARSALTSLNSLPSVPVYTPTSPKHLIHMFAACPIYAARQELEDTHTSSVCMSYDLYRLDGVMTSEISTSYINMRASHYDSLSFGMKLSECATLVFIHSSDF